MPRPRQAARLSPGQAGYVLTRMLHERRISPAEINRYLAEMQREITDLEARIAHLRRLAGAPAHSAPVAPARAPAAATPRAARKRRSRRGNPLAGSYMGYMRQVKGARKKTEFKKLKEERGFTDAIAAIKKHLGK